MKYKKFSSYWYTKCFTLCDPIFPRDQLFKRTQGYIFFVSKLRETVWGCNFGIKKLFHWKNWTIFYINPNPKRRNSCLNLLLFNPVVWEIAIELRNLKLGAPQTSWVWWHAPQLPQKILKFRVLEMPFTTIYTNVFILNNETEMQ